MKCSICGREIINSEYGRVHPGNLVHEINLSNDCPKTSCQDCPDFEPLFITVDSSGRKCAAVHYARGGMTLEQIAELYGITREGIRQIEESAKKKIQRSLLLGKKQNLDNFDIHLKKDIVAMAIQHLQNPKNRSFFRFDEFAPNDDAER